MRDRAKDIWNDAFQEALEDGFSEQEAERIADTEMLDYVDFIQNKKKED